MSNVARAWDWFGARLRAAMSPRPLGARGEAAAARSLKRLGYKIVARGQRGPLGELDLVAVDGRTVVFVEVKTRQSHDAGHPAEAVDAEKQRRLTRLALAFLKRHDLLEYPARFDVVAVTWPAGSRRPRIEHIRNAFEAAACSVEMHGGEASETMILYCVRHGESTFNTEGRLQGQSNEPRLSPLGRKHAEAVTAALSKLPIEAVFASPLTRALETAQPLADALRVPLTQDDRLKEINIGIFQGVLAAELAEVYPQEAAGWRSQDPDYRIPGGESRRELMTRAAAAFREIRAADHRQVAVVAHGGVLAAALKALLAVPAERNPFMLYNGSISIIDWGGQLKLMTLNQVDHLRLAGCELATRTGDLA